MVPRTGAPNTNIMPSTKRKRLSSSSALTRSTIKGNKRHCRRLYGRLRDWSNMGVDLLEDICNKLPLADTLISRAVCSLWRSVSQNHIPPPQSCPPSPPPILWDQHPAQLKHWLLDAAEGNLYLPNRETEKLINRNACVGSSSDGRYLLFFHEKKNKWSLLHPLVLSPFAVVIPPLPTGCDGVQKALVLSDPLSDTTSNSSSCCCFGIVVVDHEEKLFFAAKCGGQFVELEGQDDDKRSPERTEMICINNCIYVINSHVALHYMEAWDCTSSNCGGGSRPRKVLDFEPTFSSGHDPRSCSNLHLVESEGQLLLVAIRRPHDESKLNRRLIKIRCPVCMVYKMDFKEKKWVHVDSLGDRVLFIMESQTMSLSAKEFPQYQRNSIYFRRNYTQRYRAKSVLGIFNMEDGSLNEIVTTTVVGYGLRR